MRRPTPGAKGGEAGTTTAPLRVALATAMCAVVASVACAAFDGWTVAATVPVVLVGVVGLLTCRSARWVRFGGAAGAWLAGVVSSGVIAGASIGSIPRSVVGAPRRLLSTEWPSPADASIVVGIAALAGLVGVLTVELAGQRRWHAAPAMVAVLALAAATTLAAPRPPRASLLVAFGVLVLALLILRHGDAPSHRLANAVTDRAIPAAVLAITAAVVAGTATIAWSDRADPRSLAAADVAAALVDPLESVVALRSIDPPIDVFTITDRSALAGPALPRHWRLAALDSYDGQRWVPTLTLYRIGDRLGEPDPASIDAPLRYEIEVAAAETDLVPIAGRALSVEAAGPIETDPSRTTVRRVDGSAAADRLIVVTERATVAAATESVASRQIDPIAAEFTDLAVSLAGDGTILDQLRRIESTMRDEWDLDPSATGGGQQQTLLARFVTTTRRGNEEQFVTAFVLLARSLGVDARIASGFVVPPEQLSSPVRLGSQHAAVWPEVRSGQTWVAFDPVPDVQARSEVATPPPPAAQSPSAIQPPAAPDTEAADDRGLVDVTSAQPASRWSQVRAALVRGATAAVASILPIVLAVATIAAIKRRRRRRRVTHPDPATRIRGAWANVTDTLVDAGMAIERAWTNDRIAVEAGTLAGPSRHEIRRLADAATAMTFGRTERSALLVGDALATAAQVERAIRNGRTRRQRLAAWLSVRSLRRATRSPVA